MCERPATVHAAACLCGFGLAALSGMIDDGLNSALTKAAAGVSGLLAQFFVAGVEIVVVI